MDDDPALPTAAEYHRRQEHARVRARSRYRAHLTEVFTHNAAPNAAGLADVALGALTEWHYIDSGERCRCSCHPRLPDSDLHDYGFDCVCTRTAEARRSHFRNGATTLTSTGCHHKASRPATPSRPQKPPSKPG